jgi:hypothetical protein
MLSGLFLGLAFSFCARTQFLDGISPWGRELFAVLSYVAIISWPVAVYFYFVHPDWSWMYLVDSARLPAGIVLVVLFAHLASLIGGYLVGWALLKARRERQLLGLLLFAMVLPVVFGLLCRDRLLIDCNLADFRAGRASFSSEGTLGWAVAICGLGQVCGAMAVGITLYGQGRRVRVD